jgi:cell division protein FtsN
MPKDYAKRSSAHRSSNNKARKKSKTTKLTKRKQATRQSASTRKSIPWRAVVAFLVLLVILLAIAWYFVIHKPKPVTTGPIVETATPVSLAKPYIATATQASFVFQKKQDDTDAKDHAVVLQLGTFQSHDQALSTLQKKMAEYRFKTHLTKVYLHGKHYFRLQMGPYKTQKQADAVRVRLRAANIASVGVDLSG